MFFDRVQFPGGGLGAACLILDRVAGSELVRIRVCPPYVERVLADEQFEQVAAVLIFRHFYLVPTDRDLVPIPDGSHTFRGTILITPNGLQVEFLVSDR